MRMRWRALVASIEEKEALLKITVLLTGLGGIHP
jgi:hypothetical protein